MSETENPDEPPEWQGAPLGNYGPHRPYPPEKEAFDVERAPADGRCGYHESEEARFDPEEKRCGESAVYRFLVRYPEDYSWTYSLRCEEHADGPPLDALAVPEASSILWNDAAEAYIVCGSCYEQHKRDQWAGSTENPHQDKLAAALRERIEDGEPCEFCKRAAKRDS